MKIHLFINVNKSNHFTTEMKKILFLSIFGLSTFLISCGSQKKIMNSWIGLTKHDLVMNWGPPAKISDDGNGGEILVYAKQIYLPSSTFYDGVGGSSTSQSLNMWSYRMFYVDSNQKIYYWRSQNVRIPPTEINLNIYKRY